MLKKFERPVEIKGHGFIRILDGCKAAMMEALKELAGEKVNFDEARSFMESLIAEQDKDGFWSLIPSPEVDSDVRVDYWYEPTYIAAASMMVFYIKYNNEARSIGGFEDALKRGLQASTGRKLKGHGHDDIAGRLEALKIFSKGKVFKFINDYPDFHNDFEMMIIFIYNWLQKALLSGNTKGDWGEDYKDEMYRTLKLLDESSEMEEIKVFVYGTLMKCRSNHENYLWDAEYIGEFTAEDFALYDLGAYPGVVYSKGDKVKGELYRINRNILKRLDRLEGEGSLYLRFWAYLENEKGVDEAAYIYVYNHDISGKRKIEFEKQPWTHSS